MVSLQNNNPAEIISGNEMPFKLLAKARGIVLSIKQPAPQPERRSVNNTFITEFVILLGRTISNIKEGERIIVYPFGKSQKDKNIWCALELSNHCDVNLKELMFGLNLNVSKNISPRKINLSILYPEEKNSVDSKNPYSDETQIISSSIHKPFFSNLHASLKGDYNSSTDFLREANISSKEDGKFLGKVNDLILTNLNDENFNAQLLCKSIMISRSQLYRKMSLLVRRSPAAYIRHIRMENAKQMLERTSENIGDIAFEVGYTDQSHFTRAFKRHFGFHPSFYRKKCKE